MPGYYATISAAATALGSSGGTVCVRPATSGFGPGCGQGTYFETIALSGNCGLDVTFEATLPGICVHSPTSTPDPAFDFQEVGFMRILGFSQIWNLQGTASDAAIFVSDASVYVSGQAPSHEVTTSISTPVSVGGYGGIAGHATDSGFIQGYAASWEESIIGVRLDDASPFSARTCAPSSIGGTFVSEQSNVAGNVIGLELADDSSARLTRDAVRSNHRVGMVGGTSTLDITDSGVRSNVAAECSSSSDIATEPGLRVQDSAVATLFNTLWADNCTDAVQSDEPLILIENSAELQVQSSTFDKNKTTWIVRGTDSATFSITDSLLTDHAGVDSPQDPPLFGAFRT